MGVVYLAEQEKPVKRQVALKVLRSGLGTPEIAARFRSEQQTLALMEHPNITRVYDAGTTDSGLLYFVMEYVVGETITDYAASHRLKVVERIRLFIQICRAVQHAHQKGIIHRDIKPSNVIVTESDGDVVCKVIDFGISKAIAPTPGSERLTMTGMALGTPAYMSPEQFLTDGTDVDTRADIYALGAVLYELLAGVLPFDPVKHSGWAALLAQHLTHDAPSPTGQYNSLPVERRAAIAAERQTDPASLRATLSGDLDCIILEALEKDRERRYPTATAFAQDLENYLENKPVTARTATGPYRAAKFARRHRVGVGFSATLLVLLVAATIGATVQAQRLARARAVAVARQGQAEDLIGFMLGDLRDKLTATGRVDLLDDVGRRALTYFAAVPASQLSDEELFRRSQALQQLGEVRMAQGKLPAADTLLGESISIASSLTAKQPQNPRWQIGLATANFWAGNVDWQLGQVDDALAHFEPFVASSRRLIAAYPDSLGYREQLVYALNNIGFAKEANGDVTGALASYRSAVSINEALVTRDTTKLDWQVSLAAALNASAVAERKLGDLAAARAAHDHELAIKEAVIAHDTTNRERQRYVGIAHAYRSELRLLTGDPEGALRDAAAAHSIYATLAVNDTGNVSLAWSLAKSNRQMAQARLELGDASGALGNLATDQAITAELIRKSPGNPMPAVESRLADIALSRALLALGRASEALDAARRASSSADAALASKPGDMERHRAAGDAFLALGDAESRSGNTGAATKAWERAAAISDSTAQRDYQTEILAIHAMALLCLKRPAEAAPFVAKLEHRGYRLPAFMRLAHLSPRSTES